MRVTVWGLVSIVIALTVVGCGGGGGATSAVSAGSGSGASSLSAPMPSEITGTWTITNLGLPNDQMIVQTDGQVVIDTASTSRGIASATSAARSSSYTKIGTARTDGALDLNGRWTASGIEYSISGIGNIDVAARSLYVRVTVQRGSAILHEDTTVRGIKGNASEELDYPPPPPVLDSSTQDEVDYPPPPPVFD